MHPEVFDYVAKAVAEHGPFARMVEFGSLDINGTVRSLFTGEYLGMPRSSWPGEYLGIDLQPGSCVDLVADAIEWTPSEPFDCVVCCEVFEHLAAWPALVDSAARALRPGGILIVTCAGPGRGPHSAVDGNALRPDEHYANLEPAELEACLAEAFTDIHVEQRGLDVRATARRC